MRDEPTKIAAVRFTSSRSASWRVCLIFFRGILGGGTLYFLDFHQTFQPLRGILGESLRDGLPLWNPRLNNGMPLAADPLQSAFIRRTSCSRSSRPRWADAAHGPACAVRCWGSGFSAAAFDSARSLVGSGGSLRIQGITASATAFPNLAFGQAAAVARPRVGSGTDPRAARRWPRAAAFGTVVAPCCCSAIRSSCSLGQSGSWLIVRFPPQLWPFSLQSVGTTVAAPLLGSPSPCSARHRSWSPSSLRAPLGARRGLRRRGSGVGRSTRA